MAIISEPLAIGARDLLKGVEYTYCEGIDVLSYKLLRKKWKSRYVILSQGCLYIYTDRNAKKAEFSSSLKQFESAGECNPECGENICFCLRYKSAQAPIVFSCDTLERREKWVECFWAAISEVQSYTASADSGFGSAETIPTSRKLRTPQSNDEFPEYDEVNEWPFREYKDTASSAKKSDDDDDYLLPNNLSRSNSKRNGVVYENFEECRRGTFQSDATQKVQKRGIHQGVFMEELKLKIDRTCISADSVSSASCDASSYLSVRDGDDCFGTEEYLSVRGEESLYANENDTGNSSDSGNTSPVTTYETPEMPGSLKPYKFKRKDYMCHGKGEAKRELKQKPVGVFAVFPGESGELRLCVVTPHGLKYFRIHSHNERVSLFESHQSDTFSSLDSLLTFYHKNALPRKDYSVKLQKGYNTMY